MAYALIDQFRNEVQMLEAESQVITSFFKVHLIVIKQES